MHRRVEIDLTVTSLLGTVVIRRHLGGHLGVGTLKDGYVRNVPLPRVPQIQSAKQIAPSAKQIAPKAGIQLPGYLHVPSWIPTLPKLGSIIGFSQRLL